MTTDPIHDIRKVGGSTALLSPRLVHKRTPSEVLVGDYRRRGDEARFTLAIPPTHRIVPVGAQTPSPILLLQAARQAGIAATQLLLDVPSEWTFVPKAMAFSWLTEPTHFPDYGPLVLCAALWVEDIVPKNGRICELAVCTSESGWIDPSHRNRPTDMHVSQDPQAPTSAGTPGIQLEYTNRHRLPSQRPNRGKLDVRRHRLGLP